MQKLLITGINGFLGNYLATELIAKNYFVVGAGKGLCRIQPHQANLSYESLDFTTEEEVNRVFEKHQPGIVIHCGAMTKPDECELNKDAATLVNVTGTSYLLKAASVYKSHFIFLSTDFIFKGDKEIYTEEDKGDPVNFYGATKLQAEAAVRDYSFCWSIVRPILVYGHPRAGRQNIITNVASALEKGNVLNMYHDQLRTPTYVEDLANGIVSIVGKKATGIYHLSGEDQLTPYEISCAVADYLGLNKTLINPVTANTFKQPALRPPRTVFDLSKAKRELGYTVTPFNKGLQKTLQASAHQ